MTDLPELTGLVIAPTIHDLLGKAGESFGVSPTEWLPTVLADYAVAERLRHLFRLRGFTFGEVNAVVPPEFSGPPLRARQVLEALHSLRGSQDLEALAVLFKRVKNIARELKEDVPLDRALLTERAERALLEAVDLRRPTIEAAARSADYRGALTEIAGLRPVVDRFFTDVFVMVDDVRLRTARLKLMAELRNLVLDIADISEIVPQTE